MSLQNSKNKNVRDLYRGINEFKRGYQPQRNLVKELRIRMVICLQSLTTFSTGGRKLLSIIECVY
jgi:hypothetical protein